MKFLENILSNQGTNDHCFEFVSLGGLTPLLGLLNLSNMPLEFPLLPACQSVAAVCKSIVVSFEVYSWSFSCIFVLLENFIISFQCINEIHFFGKLHCWSI